MRVCVIALALGLSACTGKRGPPDRVARPVRIVPASAAAADYVAALGLVDRVVAVPEVAADYSNSDAIRERATLPQFRTEAILAVEPDLVIADWFQNRATRASLSENGVETFVLAPVATLDDVVTNLERLGTRLGVVEVAARVGQKLQLRAERLRAQHRERRPVVLPWFSYGTGTWTAGSGTIEDVMLDLAGAKNGAKLLGIHGHSEIEVERILAHPPDFVLTGEGGQVERLRASSLANLDAVAHDHVLVLPSRLRGAASPWLVDAAERLRELLDKALGR